MVVLGLWLSAWGLDLYVTTKRAQVHGLDKIEFSKLMKYLGKHLGTLRGLVLGGILQNVVLPVVLMLGGLDGLLYFIGGIKVGLGIMQGLSWILVGTGQDSGS